jgi:hypothetical protein
MFTKLVIRGVLVMGRSRSNKSKRFVQQGKIAVSKHDDRIPYHTTLAEAEAKKLENVKESSLGGIE